MLPLPEIFLKDASRLPIQCNRPRYMPPGHVVGIENRVRTSPNMCKRDLIRQYCTLPLYHVARLYSSSFHFSSVSKSLSSTNAPEADFYAVVPIAESPMLTDAAFNTRFLSPLELVLQTISGQVEFGSDRMGGKCQPVLAMALERDLVTGQRIDGAPASDAAMIGYSVEQNILHPTALILDDCYKEKYGERVKFQIISKRHMTASLKNNDYTSYPDYAVELDGTAVLTISIFDSDSSISLGMTLYFGHGVEEGYGSNVFDNPNFTELTLKKRFESAFNKGLKDAVLAKVERFILFDGSYFMLFELDPQAVINQNKELPLKGYKMVEGCAMGYTARTCILGFCWFAEWPLSAINNNIREQMFNQIDYTNGSVEETPRKHFLSQAKLRDVAANLSTISIGPKTPYLQLLHDRHKQKLDISYYITEQTGVNTYRVDWRRIYENHEIANTSAAKPGRVPATAILEQFAKADEFKRAVQIFRKTEPEWGESVVECYGFGGWQELNGNFCQFLVLEDVCGSGKAVTLNLIDCKIGPYAAHASTALTNILNCSIDPITFGYRDMALKHDGSIIFTSIRPAKHNHAANWGAFNRIWPGLRNVAPLSQAQPAAETASFVVSCDKSHPKDKRRISRLVQKFH